MRVFLFAFFAKNSILKAKRKPRTGFLKVPFWGFFVYFYFLFAKNGNKKQSSERKQRK